MWSTFVNKKWNAAQLFLMKKVDNNTKVTQSDGLCPLCPLSYILDHKMLQK